MERNMKRLKFEVVADCSGKYPMLHRITAETPDQKFLGGLLLESSRFGSCWVTDENLSAARENGCQKCFVGGDLEWALTATTAEMGEDVTDTGEGCKRWMGAAHGSS